MDATLSDLESDEEEKWRRFNFASFDPTAAWCLRV
jgi:hypothetical protein